MIAHSACQQPVETGWRATALNMPKDTDPYFSRGNFFQYFFLYFSSATKIFSFGYDDEIYQFFSSFRFFQSFDQCINVSFAFRDQNIFGTRSYSAVQSNIPGIATHYFDHKNAVVSIHSISYLINRFHSSVNGRIKADREIGPVDIFIDRTG